MLPKRFLQVFSWLPNLSPGRPRRIHPRVSTWSCKTDSQGLRQQVIETLDVGLDTPDLCKMIMLKTGTEMPDHHNHGSVENSSRPFEVAPHSRAAQGFLYLSVSTYVNKLRRVRTMLVSLKMSETNKEMYPPLGKAQNMQSQHVPCFRFYNFVLPEPSILPHIYIHLPS